MVILRRGLMRRWWILVLWIAIPAWGMRLPLHFNYNLYLPMPEGGAVAFSLIAISNRDPDLLLVKPEPSAAANHELIERMANSNAEDQIRGRFWADFERHLMTNLIDPRTQTVYESFRMRAIAKNHRESMRMLRVAHRFAKEIYEITGRYAAGSLPPRLDEDLATVLTGEQDVLIIFPRGLFDYPLQTIAKSGPDSHGFSVPEQRLLGRGLDRPLPEIPLRLNHAIRPFFSPMLPGRQSEYANRLFNLMPVWEEGRVSLKLYAKHPECNTPWFRLLRRFMSSQGWFVLRTGDLERVVPFNDSIFGAYQFEKEKIYHSGLDPARAWEELALVHQAFWKLLEWSKPELQPKFAAEILAEAVGPAPQQLYSRFFRFLNTHGAPIVDPDLNPPDTAVNERIMTELRWTTRQEFDEVSAQKWYEGTDGLAEPYIRRANVSSVFDDEGPEDCAQLVSLAEAHSEAWVHQRMPDASHWSVRRGRR